MMALTLFWSTFTKIFLPKKSKEQLIFHPKESRLCLVIRFFLLILLKSDDDFNTEVLWWSILFPADKQLIGFNVQHCPFLLHFFQIFSGFSSPIAFPLFSYSVALEVSSMVGILSCSDICSSCGMQWIADLCTCSGYWEETRHSPPPTGKGTFQL